MALYREDKRAAYLGLIAGAITLLVIVYGMVKITSTMFEGHEAAPGVEAGH
jgi:hypothetical protein